MELWKPKEVMRILSYLSEINEIKMHGLPFSSGDILKKEYNRPEWQRRVIGDGGVDMASWLDKYSDKPADLVIQELKDLLEEKQKMELELLKEKREKELELLKESKKMELELFEERRKMELELFEERRKMELEMSREKKRKEREIAAEEKRKERERIKEIKHAHNFFAWRLSQSSPSKLNNIPSFLHIVKNDSPDTISCLGSSTDCSVVASRLAHCIRTAKKSKLEMKPESMIAHAFFVLTREIDEVVIPEVSIGAGYADVLILRRLGNKSSRVQFSKTIIEFKISRHNIDMAVYQLLCYYVEEFNITVNTTADYTGFVVRSGDPEGDVKAGDCCIHVHRIQFGFRPSKIPTITSTHLGKFDLVKQGRGNANSVARFLGCFPVNYTTIIMPEDDDETPRHRKST